MLAEVLFWVCVGAIGFTYAGYPLLLGVMAMVRRRPQPPPDVTEWPMLSVLVVARNEEHQIAAKIRNILENGYPPDRIEVIVCSDGSTDGTNDRVREFGDPRVRLAASPANVGVNDAFALGEAQAAGTVLLMTDSGGLFTPGSIARAARHFADPKVGLVSGRIIFENPLQSAVGTGFQSYWIIETRVRDLESRLGFGTVIVGAFEMIRRSAYLHIPSRFNNDISAPVHVYSRGWLCRYEPEALLIAQQKKTPTQDFARRVRVAVRAWSTIPYLLGIVPFFRNAGIWLALVGHKYLRYVTGVFFLGTLAANLFLLDAPLYQAAMVLQALGYAAALAGWGLAAAGLRFRPFALPFYFCLLQTAGLIGLLKALRGQQVGTWKPVD
jgi:cellulose synthase/poly-beta-1,6-N-acetylglucosamine synthase-like glycosyltransferase